MEREESRGTHARTDHPEPDPALDGRHVVVASEGESLEWQAWS